MSRWKIAKPGTNFCDYYIPVGAVYGILPECVRNGRHHNRAFVWVSNFDLAWNHQHFTVNILHVANKRGDRAEAMPKTLYVDGNSGWAKSLQDYIRLNYGILGNVKPQILRREMATIAPRDRKVGRYMRRGFPTPGDNPEITTQDFVTNNCKVGHNFYKEEGYWGHIMNMGTPHYG